MFESQINAGIDCLDNHFGGRANWVNKIDLDTLNIAHVDDCILGQLFGDYHVGLYILGIELGIARHNNGFTCPSRMESSTLTQEWRDTIRRIRFEMEFTQAMERGIAWLDRHFQSRSWLNRIDLDNFNFGSIRLCVIGQVFQDIDTKAKRWYSDFAARYASVDEMLKSMNYTVYELGFSIDDPFNEPFNDWSWNIADAVWKSKLTQLKVLAA